MRKLLLKQQKHFITRQLSLKIPFDLAPILLQIKKTQSHTLQNVHFGPNGALGHLECEESSAGHVLKPCGLVLQDKTIKPLIFLSNSQQLTLSEKEPEI